MNNQPAASKEILQKRAYLLKKVRFFFEQRGVLEVETPCLTRFPALDLHLDSFRLEDKSGSLYLVASPEYHMKRLLAAGVGSIYQISKAFRHEEAGRYHNPEFTIIEWYREGWDHFQLMKEVESLLTELLETPPAEHVSYEELFRRTLDVNPFKINSQRFSEICATHNLPVPDYIRDSDSSSDDQLNYLMGSLIEPRLGTERPLFVRDYPASQSLMSRVYQERPEAAMRFEVYYQGLELGNGCAELNDAQEQRRRFLNENEARKKAGEKELPIDHSLIAALESGMPSCAGVALGFDRLIMAAGRQNELGKVMAFPWKTC